MCDVAYQALSQHVQQWEEPGDEANFLTVRVPKGRFTRHPVDLKLAFRFFNIKLASYIYKYDGTSITQFPCINGPTSLSGPRIPP